MQPEFMCGGLAEDVELEADPDKAEEEADAGKHQAVQLEAPPETRDARTPKFDLQALLLALPAPRGCLVAVAVFDPWQGRALVAVSTHHSPASNLWPHTAGLTGGLLSSFLS